MQVDSNLQKRLSENYGYPCRGEIDKGRSWLSRSWDNIGRQKNGGANSLSLEEEWALSVEMPRRKQGVSYIGISDRIIFFLV